MTKANKQWETQVDVVIKKLAQKEDKFPIP